MTVKGVLLRFKRKYKNIESKLRINKFHYLLILLTFLCLPLVVYSAKQQTNEATHAQAPESRVLATENQFIIPEINDDNDQETYIPPTDLKAAVTIEAQANLEDSQVLKTTPVVTASTKKSNIVFLLLDDSAYIDDRLWNVLPNIKDLFIDHGARFTQFYGETPLCCPGRAGYLTGQHTANHNVLGNSDAKRFNPDMTIATQLKSVGYYTFISGKYLNGFNANKERMPGWDNVAANGGGYQNFWLWDDGKHIYYPTSYSTNVFKAKALKFLRQAPGNKPVFAWIAPFAIHSDSTTAPHALPAPKYVGDPRCQNIPNWMPPNYNEADVSDKPSYVRNQPLVDEVNGFNLVAECETLLSVDDMLASIKAELSLEGRLQNTMFIMGVDNGMDWGAHRQYGKVWPYTTQVNFFVNWPSVIGNSPFSVSDTVMNIDLAPTLCEIGGCTMGPYPNGQKKPDGKSFLSLLKRQTTSMGRDAVMTGFLRDNKATNAPAYYALRTTSSNPLGLWYYVEYDTGEKELYDESNGPCNTWTPDKGGDPCELNNLLASNASPSDQILSIAAQLHKRLAQLKVEKGYKSTPALTPTPTLVPTPTNVSKPAR